MTTSKICCVVVMVTVLCVVAGPVGPIHSQSAAAPGGAVLFFAAHLGELRDAVFDPVVFTQLVVNLGSAYDPHTGVFTAPRAGVYQFVFTAQLCRGNHNNRWNILVNGDRRILCHAQVSNGDTNLNTCYYMEDLQRGDQVWVRQDGGSCAWASSTSRTITFSGVLLASDGLTALAGRPGSGASCPLLGPGAGRTGPPGSAGRPAALSGPAVALLAASALLLA